MTKTECDLPCFIAVLGMAQTTLSSCFDWCNPSLNSRSRIYSNGIVYAFVNPQSLWSPLPSFAPSMFLPLFSLFVFLPYVPFRFRILSLLAFYSFSFVCLSSLFIPPFLNLPFLPSTRPHPPPALSFPFLLFPLLSLPFTLSLSPLSSCFSYFFASPSCLLSSLLIIPSSHPLVLIHHLLSSFLSSRYFPLSPSLPPLHLSPLEFSVLYFHSWSSYSLITLPPLIFSLYPFPFVSYPFLSFS